ncbi:phospholipase D-like domain-containing protein [Verrucomicrobium spinosum]|uniref:phospholipase D-like domain-containing protein n=1 Tax=Verrucomicrobium spinosum TaxID=2736 RepID=UPI000174587A|nr:phospholipase D-like domain-containing protein [Verrucomicrobium spinosum]
MISFLSEILPVVKPVWHLCVIALNLVVVGYALSHVLLRNRDYRSAAFWAVLIAFVPFLGACFYALFGINRLRRRGARYRHSLELAAVGEVCPVNPWQTVPELKELRALSTSLGMLSRFGFTVGNHVTLLRNGEEAMPAMLEAIRGAQKSISLCSYIFEAHGIGMKFVEELVLAKDRGVEVRVLVDDAGTRYSWPPITHLLRSRGVMAKRFMPIRFVLRILTMNLRNHRKVMVVDGTTGFTGGMNIRQGNMLEADPSHPVQDMHFKVEGPVVQQLQRVFAEDWAFCSGEVLSGPLWYPTLAPAGEVAAIGVPDGPDEDLELMPKAIFAAISEARHSVRIMTPYFLPPPTLIWALNLAALRGVDVKVLTPRRNNIPFVRWAARTLYPEMLEKGVKIYEADGHFDHSKFMTVDGLWSLVGSTNWDPRSLRLNFEFNLACFDDLLAQELDREFEKKVRNGTLESLAALRSATLAERLRDGFARLFMPFL